VIQVSALSFSLSEFSLVFWFVYFQYYWFPQLRFKKNFSLYCALVAAGYTLIDFINPFTFNSSLLGALSVVIMLGVELGLIGYQRKWAYLPAFIEVSILAYLLIEFIDMVVIVTTIYLTNMEFATSLWGTLSEIVIDNIIFALIIMGLWMTRAPMENLIESMLGRSLEYMFLTFMATLAVVYILFEYSLQMLQRSDQYLVFLAGIAGTLLVGLSLSTYMLMQTHLQEEHTQLQRQQQAFREQYTTELNRQMSVVKKFSHDYQNMLLGLGGYLEDQDYEGFRQLYIDIRSGWATSNAAELTIDDLENVPGTSLRFRLYHNYLLARRAGVQLFVKVSDPLTATVAALKQMGTVIDELTPEILPIIKQVPPAMITLELSETSRLLRLQLTFPSPPNARVDGHNRIISDLDTLDFSNALGMIPQQGASTLQLKFHWGQLIVTLPKGSGQ